MSKKGLTFAPWLVLAGLSPLAITGCAPDAGSPDDPTTPAILSPSLEQELLSDALEPDTEGLEHYRLPLEPHAQLTARTDPAPEAYPSSKEAAMLEASRLPADQLVPILVLLPEEPFAYHVYRRPDLDPTTRSAMVALRDQRTRQRTRPMRAQLARLGAVGLTEFTIAPIVAATVRAGDIATIARWGDVAAIDIDQGPGTTLYDPYDGQDTRNGTRIASLASDVNGSQGHWDGGGRVRVGIIDTHAFYTKSPGFRRLSTDVTDTLFRDSLGVTQHFKCFGVSNSPCQLFTPTGTEDVPAHASHVARVLLGTIENGQDPTITTTAERVKRSGVIPGSGVSGYHYGIGGATSLDATAAVNALQLAVGSDPNGRVIRNDVLNMSFSFTNYSCAGPDMYVSFSTALRNALLMGALPVAAIGNSGPGYARYPACRREVLTTAWLDTVNNPAYNASTVYSQSSVGGIPTTPLGAGTSTLAVADLAAPGDWDYLYQDSGGQPIYGPWNGIDGSGSSLAAPVVSGIAALFRHGWSKHKPGVALPAADLLTHLLLLGDGYAQNQGQYAATGFDTRSGAGRVHMHHPGSASLGPNWGWSDAISFTAYPGQGARGSISTSQLPANATQLKVVMTWEEPTTGSYNTTSIARLSLEVNNTTTVLASDFSNDIRKRVSIKAASQPLLNSSTSLMWNVQALAIPAGQSRRVHVAWYWHSSPTPADH